MNKIKKFKDTIKMREFTDFLTVKKIEYTKHINPKGGYYVVYWPNLDKN